MAGSTSAEVWLDQRRWDALEEALKAQGSDIEQHLQDYLITLYNETVPQEQWEQVEKGISDEAAEAAREAEERAVYTAFHSRGTWPRQYLSQRVTVRSSWMWPYGCAVICRGCCGCEGRFLPPLL